jgi:hypothetical protein
MPYPRSLDLLFDKAALHRNGISPLMFYLPPALSQQSIKRPKAPLSNTAEATLRVVPGLDGGILGLQLPNETASALPKVFRESHTIEDHFWMMAAELDSAG